MEETYAGAAPFPRDAGDLSACEPRGTTAAFFPDRSRTCVRGRGRTSTGHPAAAVGCFLMDVPGIDPNRVPLHVAAVMDGNGRSAQRQGLRRTDGHAAGEKALFDTIEGALDLGIDWFTVYAFSTENWRRPPDEVRYLMGFNKGILERHAEDMHARNVRIRFVGRRGWRVPRGVLRRMDWALDLTKDNTGMTFTIAFNYGGRAEII